MIPGFDQGWPIHPKVAGVPKEFPRRSEEEEQARRYWLTKVPKEEQALYRVYGFIHYDRILLIDDIGDAYHEPPHIIVDCTSGQGFFDDTRTVVENGGRSSRRVLFADDSKRVELFPEVMPKISDEEFHASLSST
jgi:hypothetical protein